MMRRVARLGLCLLAGAAAAQAASPARIEGRWLTEDRKASVVISRCGDMICGAISQVLDKGSNVPTTDISNPDPSLRSRPIIGLTILSGFHPKGNGWRGGHAYDPKTGHSYRSTLALDGNDRLVVTGCILFFCQSKVWQRLP
jgi:uncharacterized protein (DUF2147 family)